MKFTPVFVACFAALALGAPFGKKQKTAGVISLDITRHETPITKPLLKSVMLANVKRLDSNNDTSDSGLFSANLLNEITHYTVSVGIGKNNKQYPLLIDTGSSDFWVSNVTDIVEVPYDYNGDASKVVSAKPFHIDYVKGSMDGYWAKNTMYFGKQIDNVDYAIVYKGRDSPKIRKGAGILGTCYSYRGGKNLPELLASEGLISKNAYSLSLANFNGTNGSILFGGVDHSKYTGDLVTVPRADLGRSTVKTLSVKLTAIAIDGARATINGGAGMAAPLDTGTTLTYLPPALYQVLASAFGVTESNTQAYGAPSFNVTEYGDREVTFDFGGAPVRVKGRDLALEFRDFTGRDHGEMKIFGIWSNVYTRGYSIFGDTFLRSAYVVYDLDGNTISLAQANKNPGEPDVEAIVDEIPGAIRAGDGDSSSAQRVNFDAEISV